MPPHHVKVPGPRGWRGWRWGYVNTSAQLHLKSWPRGVLRVDYKFTASSLQVLAPELALNLLSFQRRFTALCFVLVAFVLIALISHALQHRTRHPLLLKTVKSTKGGDPFFQTDKPFTGLSAILDVGPSGPV